MLDHADAGDRVERVLAQVAIVEITQLDLVGEPGSGDALATQLDLGGGDGDAQDVDAILARRMNREAAPSAADVEDPHARLQIELAADEVELGGLGLLERLVAVSNSAQL